MANVAFQTANVMLYNVNTHVKMFAVCAWMQIAVLQEETWTINWINNGITLLDLYTARYSSWTNISVGSEVKSTQNYRIIHKLNDTRTYVFGTTSQSRPSLQTSKFYLYH